MKSYFHHSLLIALSAAAVALVPACSSGGSSGDDDSAGKGGSGSGGTTSSGGSGGSGAAPANCGTSDNIVVMPSNTGWVDSMDACINSSGLGIQGAWYPYGDQYGTGNGAKKCLTYGMHMPSECAQIMTPDPTVMAFPNTNGEMITAGSVEQVLPCVAGSMAATIPTSGCPGGGMAGGYDYSSMWGAGIGFDLNADKGPPDGDGKKNTWDPVAHGVIGIRFDIDGLPPGGIRVEFPMQLTAAEAAADTPMVTTMPPTTDDHSAGAPYWGAKGDGKYPNSPAMPGTNTITWDMVGIPKAGVYTFDTTRLLGIQFHVPTTTASGSSYSFTIKNVTFLRHL
jgi:hypothetical protein